MRCLIASFAFASCSFPAAAQMYIPPFNFNPQLGARIVTPQLEAQAARSGRQRTDGGSADRNLPHARAVSLIYVPSAVRTRVNLTQFINKSRAGDPKGAASMERLVASTDVMAAVETEMRKVGLTKNNVADAYTAWWTNAWLATKGRNDTLPRGQLQAVKRQASAALLSSPILLQANEEQKQELAEALLIQATMIGASVDLAKEQPSLMPQLKAAVAKGARATGLDLSTMTLTDEGFRPARGSDASDAPLPVGAAREKQADARGSDAGPSYLLMAAAGGAGFAGVYLLGKRSGRKG